MFAVDYIPHCWSRDYFWYAVSLWSARVATDKRHPALLSFVTYEVIKHPEVLLKLRTEIDQVLGERPVSLEDLPKMPYTVAVMRETLRLHPPASTRSVSPAEATTIGNGKYAVTPEDTITVNIAQVQCDPEIWGDDVCVFPPLFLFPARVSSKIVPGTPL